MKSIPETLHSLADASSAKAMEDGKGRAPQGLHWWLLGMLSVGVVGDSLLRVTPFGLNISAWILFIGVSVLLLFGQERRCMSRAQGFWFGVSLVFSVLFGWRDAEGLQFLNLMSMLGTAGLAFWLAGKGRVNLGGVILTGVRMAGGIVLPLIGAFQVIGSWLMKSSLAGRLGETGFWTKGLRYFVGLIITVPIFIVFAALFASADTIFRDFVRSLFDFNINDIVAHAFFIAVFTWLGAGIFYWLWPREVKDSSDEPVSPELLGGIEVGVLLTALNGLFLVFIIFQVQYLFGGNALVQRTANLSYAEYFRNGFFELIAVSALVLPLLLVCDWLWKGSESKTRFRRLAVCLLIQLGVVMASAFKRLAMYLEAYGLTEQRLYAAAVLCWLGFAALWLALTVLRDKRPYFAPGIVMAAFVMVFALNIYNPDARIAEHQLSRKEAGKNWDLDYLLLLSADAVPVMVRCLDKLDATEKQRVMERLVGRWTHGTDDWRTSNWSRWQAAKWREDNQVLLKDVPLPREKSSRTSGDSYR
ncbi:MAG TPA: DUF4173 domain-containing protein [Verrucomicrobiae bacterium]